MNTRTSQLKKRAEKKNPCANIYAKYPNGHMFRKVCTYMNKPNHIEDDCAEQTNTQTNAHTTPTNQIIIIFFSILFCRSCCICSTILAFMLLHSFLVLVPSLASAFGVTNGNNEQMNDRKVCVITIATAI